MSAQTAQEQLQTALQQLQTQQQRIHDLEKEVQRCKSKEEMVNEYAGSMHDKLTEKDALVGMKEARIEYLEGRCPSGRYFCVVVFVVCGRFLTLSL